MSPDAGKRGCSDLALPVVAGAEGKGQVRSTLSEFVDLPGFHVRRDCEFSCPAKILTPVDDILVPLARADALPSLLSRTGIAGVVATEELASSVPSELGLAVASDPMRVLHEIHVRLAKIPGRLRSDAASVIHPTAIVHDGAHIASRGVHIDADAVVLPGAIIHEGCRIGARTRIHSHAVIGGDAYEIVMIDGQQHLRPQTGGVVIGPDCEILSGTVVTRAAFCGATTIGERVVLDCNVTVSHDVAIGSNTRVGGSSWIGGRVTIGERASLGPNCTIGNGLRVGARAKVSLGAVVTRDVADEEHVSGNFAIPHARLIEHLRTVR